jgi:hypothetical protein
LEVYSSSREGGERVIRRSRMLRPWDKGSKGESKAEVMPEWGLEWMSRVGPKGLFFGSALRAVLEIPISWDVRSAD